ncbi:MAG TPA: MtrAB system histidine kinase MtrB, partial [Microbacteriaceae bacterium]|nr:MtrAB system histidine kinase MtrB [Microbacteriaceae bacterium]
MVALPTLVPPRRNRLLGALRHSLRLRTVAITVLLTGAAIVAAGLAVSYSVAGDLYSSRLSQALHDSARATASAQATVDAADISESGAMRHLLDTALGAIGTATSSRLVASYRMPGQQATSLAPQDFRSPGLAPADISPELRAAVQNGSGKQFYQSVRLTGTGGQEDPGIVVGSQLRLPPPAGRYELYIGYDLSAAAATLAFVQRTLLIAGIALIVLMAAITWVIVRFVVQPIKLAAETSKRLAAGELGVRIPERGADVFAALAASFNGMADSLQHQITRLAALSRLQQRFVSDVSHELRTPLTTIRLAEGVIYDQRESLDPAAQRSAELLHAQVERFGRLLVDLLEISRYDAGSAVMELEQVDLAQLARTVVGEMRPLAARHDTRLLVSGEPGATASLDARRIRRIIRNLIGNAIEHGEARPIRVRVAYDESSVALSVRDQGVGIAADQVGHVFDRFWRADRSRQRTIGGTGLGLAISMEDAIAHHGTLEVWSRP